MKIKADLSKQKFWNLKSDHKMISINTPRHSMEVENVRNRTDSIKNAWNHCLYCENEKFKVLQDFTRHLREKHCSIEGGSFVCLYGYNSVCNSLPIDGVSDEDYVDHINKHHAFPQLTSNYREEIGYAGRKLSNSSQYSSSSEQANNQWTIYLANQNLAAVLNDPNKGKQKDFFTKLWGVDFTEKISSDIPKHPYLPEIHYSHFENYLKKISKRHKRHMKLNEVKSSKLGQAGTNEILHLFPKLRIQRSLSFDRKPLEKHEIPPIFLQTDFDLSKPEIFYTVFPFAKDEKPGNVSFQQNGKLLQEKLTHDLDQVEVLIAEQVAQKSDAFFQAMTSHDALMDELAKTLLIVKSLRHEILMIDDCWVKKSLQILQLKRQQKNRIYVLEKLKLMNTLHQTQPTIQTLLSAPDYVAALELISTTQELLNEELQGIHSFRHLGSQLNEINRLIDKMMNNEFENYATKDLNRPFNDGIQLVEMDKLKSILLGMLKRKNTQFISKYKLEAFTTIKTTVKQTVLEALADNDCDADGPYNVEQAQNLDLNKWIELMDNVTQSLVKLLLRIKMVHDVMKETVDLSMGQPYSSQENESFEKEGSTMKATLDDLSTSELRVTENSKSEIHSEMAFLTKSEYMKVHSELKELLISVCDFSHDECAKLLTTLVKSKAAKEKNLKGNDKLASNGSLSVFENVNAKQIYRLSKIIENFTFECEKISSKSPTSLKGAFQYQANKFMNKFHNERKEKLTLILEKETWAPAEVEPSFQFFLDNIISNKCISRSLFEGDINSKPNPFLIINDEKYIVVGAALFLLQMVKEYSYMAEDLSLLTFNILRNLAELLFLFNSRSCQLVLGAGALQTAKLRTITTTNLVLTSRSLQVIIILIPYISKHFSDILHRTTPVNFGTTGSTKNPSANDLNEVKKYMRDHINKLHAKVVIIVSSVISSEISNWGAKPPVPSVCFRQISKHLSKLHEAVAGILPPNQIEELYKNIHTSFKSSLREQLKKLNIVNNGGPQHGTVTSELLFYVEMLKKLQVFQSEELTENSLEDIWL